MNFRVISTAEKLYVYTRMELVCTPELV